MAKDSSPICFRVSSDERFKLEAAASYVGESLSGFMRRAAIEIADEVMEAGGGVDEVARRHGEVLARNAEFQERDRQRG